MPRIVVIHYEPAEAVLLAERLRREGFDAGPYLHRGTKGFRGIRENPPDAILIDLFRLPSYGKAMGALLREQKGTRMIPLVFLEGDPEKAEPVRQLLPDAVIAPLARIGPALRRAIARPPADPLQPQLKVSLLRKLNIKEHSAVALVNPPDEFALPAGARIVPKPDAADVVLIFVRSAAALGRALPSIAAAMRPGRSQWIVWPKQKAGAASILTMPAIRDMCRAFGLIDYKVCAVDETWSALVVGRMRK